MILQEKIKKDLMVAMKEKDEEKKNTLRIIMGEIARADKKTLSDGEVVRIMQKLVKSERETLEQSETSADSRYIGIIESYMPQMASDDEIREWIENNIDFSGYKNKMQAMRDILAHFGSKAEGDRVKSILQQM